MIFIYSTHWGVGGRCWSDHNKPWVKLDGPFQLFWNSPSIGHCNFAQKSLRVLKQWIKKKEPWYRSQKSWVLVPTVQVTLEESCWGGDTDQIISLLCSSAFSSVKSNAITILTYREHCPLFFLEHFFEWLLSLRDFFPHLLYTTFLLIQLLPVHVVRPYCFIANPFNSSHAALDSSSFHYSPLAGKLASSYDPATSGPIWKVFPWRCSWQLTYWGCSGVSEVSWDSAGTSVSMACSLPSPGPLTPLAGTCLDWRHWTKLGRQTQSVWLKMKCCWVYGR